MRIHTTELLGPKQSMTPDGFLLCEGVAIARTGDQRYIAADFADPDDPDAEPPVEPGADGLIRIARDEDQVFRPETIASFEGKPIVIGHTFVNPGNAMEISVGHVQNVRRGVGLDADLLLADMLIMDADAIKQVRSDPGIKPLREVSCGYDADYEQISVGHGRQHNIIGNHVALVPRGRAGMRCSIQDEETTPMKTAKQRLLALVRGLTTKDEDLESTVEMMDEMTAEEKEKAKTADSIATLTKTVDALTTAVAALTKTKDEHTDGTGVHVISEDEDLDDEKKAKAMVGDAMSGAEILSPGFKNTMAIKRTADVVALQRTVLGAVVKTADGAALLKPFLRGRTVDTLSADAVAATFDAAAELQRAVNNAAGFKQPSAQRTRDMSTYDSIAAINERNKAFYNQK